MKTLGCFGSIVLLLSLASAFPAAADVLVMLNETAIQGTYKGGTDAAVVFEVQGAVQQVNVAEISCLILAPRPGAPPAAATAASTGSGPTTVLLADGNVMRGIYKGGTDAAVILEVKGAVQQLALANVRVVLNSPPPPPAMEAATHAVATPPATGTVPAGTKLLITLTGDVSSATHPKGAVVEGVLATPLTVNGAVYAPEGTKVFGKVSDSRGGKALGGSYIMFSFTSMQLGDATIPIQTSEVGAEAGKGGTAKKVGAGALICAAAGDAGAGAAVGGAVALLSSRNNHVGIPKGTKAEVALAADVKIGG